MMPTSMDRFTAQINDEFLTCKICYEAFKEPKCLTCLHTFCKSCIEKNLSTRSYNYSRYCKDFSCPICRKKTQIPTGGVSRFQDNFLVASLSDLVAEKRKKSDVVQCHFCLQSSGGCLPASYRCIDCQRALCEQCYKLHQQNPLSSEHDMYELSIEKDITCQYHPREIVRFFCTDCDQCVCIVCACGTSRSKFSHNKHSLTNFRTAASHRRGLLATKLLACKQKEKYLEKHLQNLDKFKNMLLLTKENICDACQQYHKDIDRAEHSLLGELEDRIEPEMKKMMDEMLDLRLLQEQLSNTCSLTELMLAGSDIELMMMVKQLSGKLNELDSKQFKHLDSSDDILFTFEQGHMDFGRIVSNTNIDNKLASGEIRLSSEGQANVISVAEVAIQTDLSDPPSNNNIDDADGRMHDIDSADPNQINPLLSTDTNEVDNNGEDESSKHRVSSPPPPSSSFSYTTLKKVRRLLKKDSCAAVLPNGDTMVLDPSANCIIFLNKQGRIVYFLSDSSTCSSPACAGVGNFKSLTVTDVSEPRAVSIDTPQGTLSINFKETGQRLKLPVAFTVHAYNSMSMVDAE